MFRSHALLFFKVLADKFCQCLWAAKPHWLIQLIFLKAQLALKMKKWRINCFKSCRSSYLLQWLCLPVARLSRRGTQKGCLHLMANVRETIQWSVQNDFLFSRFGERKTVQERHKNRVSAFRALVKRFQNYRPHKKGALAVGKLPLFSSRIGLRDPSCFD